MNWLDMGLIIILAGFTAKGLFQGMMRQIIGLVSILASLLLATRASHWLAVRFARLPSLRPLALPMAFAILAIGVWALLNLLGILWYKHSRQDNEDHWLDDLAGGIVGFLTGMTLLTILVMGATSLELISAKRASESAVMSWIMDTAGAVIGHVP